MSIRLEDAIVRTIKDDYFSFGFNFTNRILQNITLYSWALATPKDTLKKEIDASNSSCLNFRTSHHQAWRKVHAIRRPINDIKFKAIAD
jgi:hypothetical protein